MTTNPPTTPDSGPSAADAGVIPRGIRIALTAAAVFLVAGAGLIWLPEPPPTLQTKTEITTDSSKPGQTIEKVTTTLSGRPADERNAEPAGAPNRRSDTIALALLAAAALLAVLGAIGRVPTKLGLGTVSAEWVPREAATRATAALAAVAAEQGEKDKDRLSLAAVEMYNRSLRDALSTPRRRDSSSQAYPTVSPESALGTSPGDEYFRDIAREALNAVRHSQG